MCEEYTGPDALWIRRIQIHNSSNWPKKTKSSGSRSSKCELPLQQKRRLSFQSSFFWREYRHHSDHRLFPAA